MQRSYPAESKGKPSAARAVERGLSDGEVAEEIGRAERGEIEPAAWRDEWLERLVAERERRKAS